jgi:ribosomal protein S18 acetylase RimI-like enzyme
MIKIRKMEENDLFFLFNLLNRSEIINAINIKVFNTLDETIETINKYWKNDDDENHFIILLDDTPVGWLKINGLKKLDTIGISELIILPEYQHKGLGTYTIAFVEEYCLNKNVNKIGIHTQENNINARELYKKHGYKIIAEKEIEMNNKLIMDYTFIKEITR